MPSTLPSLVRFADFEVDLRAGQLRKQGVKIRLQEQPFRLLSVLLESAEEVVTREELRARLWPADTFVDFDHRLAVAVSKLRDALRDSAENPRFVETIGRRGYRLMVPVESVDRVSGRGAPASSEEQVPALPKPTVEASEQIVVPDLSRQLKRKRRQIFFVSAILVLIVTAIAITQSSYFTPRKKIQPTALRSLAILPFENVRTNPDDDFLGFSLADAAITKLGYVSSLTVRPSSDVEKYRGKVIDIRKVATDLNVETLLTGNFIHEGDDLRVTSQLIDVNADKILWRDTFDLKFDKLLTVQDKVAHQIIAGLELNLSPSETERLKPDQPINPLAYEYYLRGVDLHSRHSFPLAIEMFEKSAEIDPNYALTWAYLGASYTSDAAFELGGRQQYRRAQAAYERALSLQPGQLEAQMFLANLLIDTGKLEQAVPLLQDALKTNPNHAAVHWELGYAYRFAGMLNESVAECERARQIDPLVKANGSTCNTYLYLGQYGKFLATLPDPAGLSDPADSAFVLFYRGFGEYYLNHWEQARKHFDHAFDLDPYLYTQIGKAFSDSIAHKRPDGIEILRGLEHRISERGVGDPEAMYKIGQAYVALGDNVSAMRLLSQSVENGFFCYPYFTTDPLLNGLRNEPEFATLLKIAQQRHETFRTTFF